MQWATHTTGCGNSGKVLAMSRTSRKRSLAGSHSESKLLASSKPWIDQKRDRRSKKRDGSSGFQITADARILGLLYLGGIKGDAGGSSGRILVLALQGPGSIPASNLAYVCGHRPKTKELLKLFLFLLFFTIWFISSYKWDIMQKFLPEAGFKPLTSCSTGHHSTDWATEP